MNLAVVTKYAVALLPLLVGSSPVPSDKSSHLDSHVRTFPHSPHILPLKGVSRQRRSSRLRGRSDATALIDPASQRDFLVSVSLGGQTVDLDLDTGSSNTWAISEGYTCVAGYACNMGNAIAVDNEFTIFEDVTFYTNYTDTSNAAGILAKTSVAFGGITVSEQTIGLVDSVSLKNKIKG